MTVGFLFFFLMPVTCQREYFSPNLEILFRITSLFLGLVKSRFVKSRFSFFLEACVRSLFWSIFLFSAGFQGEVWNPAGHVFLCWSAKPVPDSFCYPLAL